MKFLLPFGRQKYTDWPDEKLLEAFRRDGAEQYFNVLFERYHPVVYAWCLKWTNNREDSKDLTFLVFERLYELSGQLQVQNFNAWLYSVTKNHCMNLFRTQKKTEQRNQAWSYTIKNLVEIVEFPDFERHSKKEDLLKEAMKELSLEQKTCIALFFEENLSYKTIQEVTGYTEKEVKSYLQNGKRRLKVILTKQIKAQQNER